MTVLTLTPVSATYAGTYPGSSTFPGAAVYPGAGTQISLSASSAGSLTLSPKSAGALN